MSEVERFGVRCSSYPSSSIYLVGAWVRDAYPIIRSLSLFTRELPERFLGAFDDARLVLLRVRRAFEDSDATFCIERAR